jgi:hypothetical protein
MSFSLSSLLQTVAPALATAVGGPGAGLVVSAISNTIFGHPKASEEEISSAIQTNDPSVLLKIKQCELDFIVKQKEQENEALRLKLNDIQNARNTDADETKTTGKRDPLRRNLAYGLLMLCTLNAGIIFYLSIRALTIPQDLLMTLGMVLQFSFNEFKSVLNFLFGSSQSSQDKDSIIANLKNNNG